MAEQSQQNATEIEQLIDGIQSDTNSTVSSLETTTGSTRSQPIEDGSF